MKYSKIAKRLGCRRIPGFPDYWASRSGRVYSAKRNRFTRVGQRVRIRKGLKNDYPVINIVLSKGVKKRRFIHVLIALTFKGPCPKGMQTRHLNGDRWDSRNCNLRYGTAEQNSRDRRRHGTWLVGEMFPAAKLTTRDVVKMRKEYKQSPDRRFVSRMADKFGVTKVCIYQAINRLTWKEAV